MMRGVIVVDESLTVVFEHLCDTDSIIALEDRCLNYE